VAGQLSQLVSSQESAGQQSAAQQSAAQVSAGQQSAGQQSAGQEPTAQQSAGQQPAGQQPAGQESSGQESAGQESAGQPSGGAGSEEQRAEARELARRWTSLIGSWHSSSRGRLLSCHCRRLKVLRPDRRRLAAARRRAQQQTQRSLAQSGAQSADGFSEPPEAEPFEVSRVSRERNANWGRLRGQSAEDVSRGRGAGFGGVSKKRGNLLPCVVRTISKIAQIPGGK
jgi:hypothetical protein